MRWQSRVLAKKASSDSLVWLEWWTGKGKTDCHVLGKEKGARQARGLGLNLSSPGDLEQITEFY